MWNSPKQNWHIAVDTQQELINAINWVNNNGGTIYIDGNINVHQNLPTITRNNVTILSRQGNVITDMQAGGSSASELFRVAATGFRMQNVTIQGIGHQNPNNPAAWPGKRSAVAVTKNGSTFDRVFIRFFTHAAIRLENGANHRVLNSTLVRQGRTDLGYGVLLRNNANQVLVKNNIMSGNSHAVATTGGGNQSYRAEGNWVYGQTKWHFDAHMGPDGWAGNYVEIINNVTDGNSSLVLVRGPFRNTNRIQRNLVNRPAGRVAELKPDATFSRGGFTFWAGNFYSPFGLSQDAARVFFNGDIINQNCVNQNYQAIRDSVN